MDGVSHRAFATNVDNFKALDEFFELLARPLKPVVYDSDGDEVCNEIFTLNGDPSARDMDPVRFEFNGVEWLRIFSSESELEPVTFDRVD
jgi:hypothetical protein